MNKILNFVRMKYEQYLMRSFDRILNRISKTRVNWYPKFILCDGLEDKIHELEIENGKLEWGLIQQDEEIESLQEKIEFYEGSWYQQNKAAEEAEKEQQEWIESLIRRP